ncbi:MAG: T9SS type A sorting domain-containing protein [Bacteroidetes bacterium]|nr:T9SS type A sorting domain-containing protein [Bacteroidota bacterium]
MKKIILCIVLNISILAAVIGQINSDIYVYSVSFDDTSYLSHFSFDSVPGTPNIWQIGAPQKPVLNTPFSPPNVIITDTINPYPTNSQSSFTVWNVMDDFQSFVLYVAGMYYIDSDSLNDYGKIELSADNGNTWIDIVNDTVYSQYLYWWTMKPILTGRSNGWKDFYVMYDWDIYSALDIQPGDTILYRFSFFSDDIFDNRDGLMYDELIFADWYEGFPEYDKLRLSYCHPNPVSGQVTITIGKPFALGKMMIFSLQGKLVGESEMDGSGSVTFSTASYPPGVYFYRFISDQGTILATGKFVKRK